MQVSMKRVAASQRAVQQRGNRTVSCAALPDRRAVLFTAMIPSFLAAAPNALALIPDEEDEELVERAKANRAARLAQQKATTNAFMADEGLANRSLSQDLIPVQKAVYKLAEFGSALEGGNVIDGSILLTQGWVADFKAAATKVSGSSADPVISTMTGLQLAAESGDLDASKKLYVELVDNMQAWATSSGLSASLKGL